MDIAVMYDQGSVIEALADHGAATAWDVPGETGAIQHRDMLVHAAEHNSSSAVRALVAKGAGINRAYVYWSRTTPLIAAAKEGFVGISSLLIDAGADSEGKDADGRTALWHAAWNQHAGALRMLIDHGAERETNDGSSFSARTVLYSAATAFYDKDSVPRIKLLLEHGFDVEAEDTYNATPYRAMKYCSPH